MPSSTLAVFKDKLGRFRSKSLFIEFEHPDYPAIFTLHEEDREVRGTTYISAKRKYLEYKDPTEHAFAQAVFGSYRCWQAVCASPDLRPHVEEWRSELELLLRAEGYAALRTKASAGDVAAAKALAVISTAKARQPGTTESKKDRAPGRPRKAGTSINPAHEDAYERLFPSTVPVVLSTFTPPSETTITVIADDNEYEYFN